MPIMKKTIAFLPKKKQEDLRYIVGLILERLPETVMIILFGSYARNEYVDYDEREEFGIRSIKISDYDILVVTDGITDKDAGKKLDNVEDVYSNKHKDSKRQTPVQFINESITNLNKCLSERRYFYTQIKREGIILYNSDKFKLARRRKLRYDEIKQQAEDYYSKVMKKANGFLSGANSFDKDKDYQLAAFMLHQACENYYHTIQLVFELDNNKQHNLAKLSGSVKKYSDDLAKIFPRNTKEEKRLFNLIKSSYVEGRYNHDFEVTKADIDALIPKVELLRDITQQICEQKIQEYKRLILKNN